MMIGMRISFNVARYVLVCLLLGALAWGQVASSAPAVLKPAQAGSAESKTAPALQSQPSETLDAASDVPVITISGLCDNPPTDSAAASNCTTVITRAGFENVIGAVQPNMSARARREFALRYANALVMAKRAEQMGLDKGPVFEEQMRVARIQILSQALSTAIQKDASQISEQDIVSYYRNNLSSFQQAEMERIHVPKTQSQPAFTDNELSKANEQSQSQRAGKSMKEVADELRARAIAGEDFAKLQAGAYGIAGIKTAASPNMGKIRRVSLPPSQVWVMDLKAGEISPVIPDANGYFIYKVETKETLSLDQTREEIRGILRSRRIQDETRDIQEAATPTLNEVYFRPRRAPQGVAKASE